MEKLTIIPSWN